RLGDESLRLVVAVDVEDDEFVVAGWQAAEQAGNDGVGEHGGVDRRLEGEDWRNLAQSAFLRQPVESGANLLGHPPGLLAGVDGKGVVFGRVELRQHRTPGELVEAEEI